MAVVDKFLDGTVAAGTTTTIQPASGTIFSFKRGRIAVTSGGGSYFYLYIPITFYSSLDYTTSVGTSGNGNIWIATYSYYLFSEAGITAGWVVGNGGVGNRAGTSPFAAISNTNTVGISAASNILTYYTMVGVSMT